MLKRNLKVMAVTWAIMSPFMAATNVYFSLYVLELGGTPAEVGLVLMASFLALAVSRVFGGYLADAVGRKRIIVPMTVLAGLSNLIMAFAPTWEWLLWGSVLESIALLYQPAIQAIMADSLPAETRGRGITAAQAPSQILSLAGPPLATVMVSLMGLERAVRLLYIMSSISIMLAGFIRLFLVETQSSRKISFKDAVMSYLESIKLLKGDLGKLIIITSAVRGVYRMSFPFVQIYAVKVLGVSEEFWGVISTVMSLESTITSLISGYLADRLGRNAVLFLGYVSGALGLGLLCMAPVGEPLYVLAAMMVAVAFASKPAAFALMADLTRREFRGRISALSGLVEGTVSGMTSGVGGVVYQALGGLTFGIASILLIPLALASLKALPSGEVSI